MNAFENPAKSPVRKEKTIAQIFLWPLLIGIVSTIGLVGALLEDGLWDVLFCAALAVPVMIGGAFASRRGSSNQK